MVQPSDGRSFAADRTPPQLPSAAGPCQADQVAGIAACVFADAAAVAAATAACILAQAAAAVAARGRFRLCLAGGTTPTAAYRLLAGQSADWAAWWVYHGDERCLPANDPERNSEMATQAWLGQVPIPPEQVLTIPAELGAAAAAAAYTAPVRAALPFDLVLLGMGEDGHTASLFPGQEQGFTAAGDTLVVAVADAPKPPPARVSLSARALADCRALLVLVTGAGKAQALAQWRAGVPLPVARVAAAAPSLVLLDAAAAGC